MRERAGRYLFHFSVDRRQPRDVAFDREAGRRQAGFELQARVEDDVRAPVSKGEDRRQRKAIAIRLDLVPLDADRLLEFEKREGAALRRIVGRSSQQPERDDRNGRDERAAAGHRPRPVGAAGGGRFAVLPRLTRFASS